MTDIKRNRMGINILLFRQRFFDLVHILKRMINKRRAFEAARLLRTYFTRTYFTLCSLRRCCQMTERDGKLTRISLIKSASTNARLSCRRIDPLKERVH